MERTEADVKMRGLFHQLCRGSVLLVLFLMLAQQGTYYTVVAEAPGFMSARSNFKLDVGEVERIGFALTLGSVSETVEVRGTGARRQGAPQRPSVVFVLADDMGWGDATCNRSDSLAPTPNIDRIAREGIRFTNPHAPASVSSPTRCGFLTGRCAWRTAMREGVLYRFCPALISQRTHDDRAAPQAAWLCQQTIPQVACWPGLDAGGGRPWRLGIRAFEHRGAAPGLFHQRWTQGRSRPA